MQNPNASIALPSKTQFYNNEFQEKNTKDLMQILPFS